MNFTLWNGVIVVPVVVGEGVPVAAALNTGLPLSMLSPQLAAKNGVKATGTRQVEVLDHKITVAGAPDQTVRFAHISLSGVPFGVCDLLDQVSGKPTEGAPQVWIGTSAFYGLALTIDPQKTELVFRAANAPLPGKSVRVPFVLRDGRIWVDVLANGKEKFEAMIDTGSAATLIPPKVARALQLKAETTLDMQDHNGKPAKVGVGKLDQAALGKLVVKDVPVLYVAEGDPQVINQDFAVLGNDFLFRHRVTIDFGRKEVAFEPLALEKPKKGDKPKKDEPPKKDEQPKDGDKPPPPAAE